MENVHDDEIENYRILLRFSLSQNNYSCQIPKNWTVKILKNFILHSFKNELRNNFTLIYCGKILQNDDQVISSILKKEELLNQIFVTIKNEGTKQESKFEKNLKDTKKFDITQTAAFQLAEKGLTLNALEKLANFNVNGNNASVNNHFVNKNLDIISRMPLFSSQLKDRVAFETRKNRLNIFSFEDTIIENYPVRDYFKFEILFKLIMFFILFGFQIKGYNLPIFVSLLVVYYWYNVYTDVKAYYNKKEEAIKQFIKETDPKLLEQESEENSEYESEDEKSELILSPDQNKNQQENKIEKTDLNLEPKPENEGIHSNIELTNIQKLSKEKPEEVNTEKGFDNKITNNGLNNIDKINQFFDSKIEKEKAENIDKNDDIKIESENLKMINENENIINTENTQAVNRKISENLNSENNANTGQMINEMKDIAPMLEKFEKKKKKRENVPEGPINLIPAWSDEFENNNPIIPNTIEANNNPNQNINNNALNNNEQIQNNENQNNSNNINLVDRAIQEEAKEDFNEKNIRNLNQGQSNNLNEYEDTQLNEQEQQFIENNSLQFKRISLKEPAEIKENEKQTLDTNSLSERLYNKSANDKILNSEMEKVRRKIIVNEDTGSKNENEFVFPENLNLDNLSYNEAFLESNKKKINDEDSNKMN